jgi:hypothetical protein
MDGRRTAILIAAGMAVGLAAFALVAVARRRRPSPAPHPRAPRRRSGEAKPPKALKKRPPGVPYVSPDLGLVFQCPVRWEVEESARENIRLATCRPRALGDPKATGATHEVTVFVEELKRPTKLDEYKSISLQTLTEAVGPHSEVTIEGEKRTTFAGRGGWEVLYTQRLPAEGDHQAQALRLWTVFTVVGDRVVGVQYTSSRDPEMYADDVHQIADTLRVAGDAPCGAG